MPLVARSPERLRADARRIFGAGVAAVDPERAVRSGLARAGGAVLAGGRRFPVLRGGRLLLVGLGKAAGPMLAAAEEVLGDLVTEGIGVTRRGQGTPLSRCRLLEAGHPVPDEAGLAAAREVERLVGAAAEPDLVLVLVSGGGSALLPAPAPGVSLAEKQAVTSLLLDAGADIGDLNAVRKHLSRLKGGGLARLAAPARVLALILSDVVGDPLDVVASGPTVPDPTTFAAALAVLSRRGVLGRAPPAVVAHLERGARGELPETPKPGDPIFARCAAVLVGSNRIAVEAAAREARRLGWRPLVLTASLTGEVAGVLAAIAREAAETGRPAAPPCCLLAGGETTVAVRGPGRGGRNQELALSAAFGLSGLRRVLLLSAGTDGIDGPTDAAGAFADGATLARARDLGLDPLLALERNDAHPLFEALGDLLVTGPTGTNVMDLQVLLVGSTPRRGSRPRSRSRRRPGSPRA